MLLIKNSIINLYSISKIEIFDVKMSIENRKRVIVITLTFLKLPLKASWTKILVDAHSATQNSPNTYHKNSSLTLIGNISGISPTVISAGIFPETKSKKIFWSLTSYATDKLCVHTYTLSHRNHGDVTSDIWSMTSYATDRLPVRMCVCAWYVVTVVSTSRKNIQAQSSSWAKVRQLHPAGFTETKSMIINFSRVRK